MDPVWLVLWAEARPSGVCSSPAPPFLRPQTTWELMTLLTRPGGGVRTGGAPGPGSAPTDAGAVWTQT